MPRLLEQYKTRVLPELKTELKLVNSLAVPRLEKVVVNAGLGRILAQEPKALEACLESLRKITGQQPVITQAQKAISGFKIRKGQTVGLRLTLRGYRMYEFLDKLINAALPRARDFRGISRNGFDGHGNYSLGLREHLVFPEMAQEDIEGSFGMEVTVVTTAKTDERAYKLLKMLGFPFKD